MLNVVGIDEAGRGPLAGPVTAACVYIPEVKRGLSFWESVTDSKKLTAKKREYLFGHITEHCSFGIAEASALEIDAINIHQATLLAMKRAYEACGDIANDHHALIDGKFCPRIACKAQAVVGGDGKHLEIGAASILAKVTRDRLMHQLDALFPVYGWAKNAGYGTPEHMAAIEAHGITDHHRKSFAPCAKFAA